MFRLVRLCLSFAALWAALPAAAAALRVVHQGVESTTDLRLQYDWVVLRAALEKTRPAYGDFVLAGAEEKMSAARSLGEILDPHGRIDVLARATSKDLERKLRPIRIPVDRGLLGYRLMLVRGAELPRFAAVRTLAELRPFVFGQGRDWVDVGILHAAGLNVLRAPNYEGLFAMLSVGRFDAFPRGVDEAFLEYDEHHAALPGLAVEPHLLLYYPLPRYFFTRRDAAGEALARRIEAGMNQMVRDGSLLDLFRRYKGPLLERAHLKERLLLRLPNPELSPETPLQRPELWYDPFRER